MSNFKLVKTAAALALGASVVTSAVATTDASAASKYKIKSGKLVYAKSGKVVKGYVTYKSTVYKNGSKLTGLKGKTYYKAGKKATGTYKGAYYVKGVKKVTTGTYNKAYYVKGVKKVSTGLYASKYYKDGKLATGTYKGAYYVKGLKKVTTGTYNGAYYVKGKKVVSTGLYADKLYVDGKLNKGYKLYNENLYKDAVLNTELALFEGKLYDGAKLNEGHKIFKDELYKGSELNKELALFEGKLYDGAKLNEGIKKFEDKWYNNAELADGTFTVEGVEKAFENGVEVGAKVKSVEAINAAQMKITFNKSLDSKSVFADQSKKDAGTIKTDLVKFAGTDLTAADYFTELSADGKTLTFTAKSKAKAFFTNTDANYVLNVADEKLKTTGGEFIPKFSKLVSVKDSVAPTLVKTTQVNAKKVALQFSEPIDGDSSHTTVTATLADGTPVTITGAVDTKDATVFNLDLTALDNGKTASVKIIGLTDYATNLTETNPLTLSVTAGQKDDVAPEVSTITQTGAKEFTVKFSEELQNPLNTGATSLKTLTTLTDQGAGATAVTKVEQDKTDKTKYVFTTDKVLDAVTTVSFAAGLTDLSGTSALASSKVVNFTKDAAAPTVSSYQVVKDSTTGKEYLELTFDKNVVLSTATATATAGTSYVKDYITTPFTGSAAAVSYKDVDVSKKVVRVALSDLIGTANDKEGAVYTTALTLANITSESGTAVTSATAKFTRGTDTQASSNAKLTVTDIAAVSGNNNKITVKFDKAVDGVTATDVANYSVQGAVVESVTLAAVAGDGTQTATINLKKDSNVNTGYLNVSVSNVKNYDKTRTVEAITKAVNLTENVRPTVKTATLTNKTSITLTFSEAVKTTANDFDVYVGGTKLTSGVTTAVEATGSKTIVITIPEVSAAQITSGIVVKPRDANATVDTNGNVLNFTSINVAQ